MYRLMVTDIDGTLYDDEKRVGEQDRNAVRRMLEMGMKIVLSSGRDYRGMKALADELELDGVFHIATNGTCLFDTEGAVRITETLDREEYEKLIMHLRKNSPSFVVISKECIWYETDDERCIETLGENNGDCPYLKTDDLINVIEPFQVIAFFESNEMCEKILSLSMDKISRAVTYRLETEDSVTGLIDCVSAKTDKFKALGSIIKDLGISPEEVIGVGNSDNDIPIVENAGLGVCVNNSSENLKRVSDVVLSRTNNENPMEEILYEIILSGE